LKPSKLIQGLPIKGDMPMAYLLSAVQAANFVNEANFAVQRAQSAGCMVAFDSERLRMYPTAPQLTMEMEVLEHDQISFSPDTISAKNLEDSKNIKS
jgi:hypothetical protein